MIGAWNGKEIYFAVPATSKHALVLFSHTKRWKMQFKVKRADGANAYDFLNCDGAKVKSHDYYVFDPGYSYVIEVLYDNFDCSNAGDPAKYPHKDNYVQFAASLGSTGYMTEQFLLRDAAGVALCGITIIVIDDIVGPDASSSQQ